MEFLDPQRLRAHKIRLIIGYVLIGLIIVLTTIILLYQASGFGIKNGEVIQNGRVFVSSRPANADVYINGQRYKDATNTSILLEAGQYTFELKRDGYRTWKRAINVEGGTVMRFDYPVLFPVKLTSTAAKIYEAKPHLVLQSPDRRWLLIQPAAALPSFDVYDLSNPDQSPLSISIPADLLSGQDGQSWEFVEWSTDNRHVLLRHLYQQEGVQASEYIMLDRDEPANTINLTRTLGTNPTHVELRDKKYDQYYLFDSQSGKLMSASLKKTEPSLVLDHVAAFKSHGSERILYATTQGASEGKAMVRLRDGDKTYDIREVSQGDTYLLDLAEYNGDWIIAAGAAADNRTYVYENPVAARKVNATRPLVPVYIIKLQAPSYMAFSDTARFIMAQSGDSFAVFDAENEKGYAYQLKTPIDDPQQHATWMDGHRLKLVSNGKLVVFDFDDVNQETLVDANADAGGFFDNKYRSLYAMNTQTAKDAAGNDVQRFALMRTSLLTPQDQ